MNMNHIDIARRSKKCIKQWLRFDDAKKERQCPFIDIYSISSTYPCERICKNWFPKCKTKSVITCPCDRYSLQTVIKRAEEMIKS